MSFNPGRIDPTNEAFTISRKPLVAHWQTPGGAKLFTINVHFSSKGGSSSTQGDARPPVNSPIQARINQFNATAVSSLQASPFGALNDRNAQSFIQTILAADQQANIVLAGDFNEFIQTRAVFKPLTDILTSIDEAANVPEVERYSYVFDQNSQQLDHVLISNAVKERGVEFEHIHINTWTSTKAGQISDHDPSVGQIRVC
ncbi:hypothetical protein DXG03_003621 [Asterophora parasitica]|uniref:Endonuclease/exonuclease/phosphatase domain-containing protein n=1 Tax=Asterophora parasitica TaxID=117018 RepID=A0A9P7G7H0_9AGAR|nr:hypothetical protein DXG03_003621 [Asterophora parasitica]